MGNGERLAMGCAHGLDSSSTNCTSSGKSDAADASSSSQASSLGWLQKQNQRRRAMQVTKSMGVPPKEFRGDRAFMMRVLSTVGPDSLQYATEDAASQHVRREYHQSQDTES